VVQGESKGAVTSRRRKRAVCVILALAVIAAGLGVGQLLLPQELILEKAKDRMEAEWGVRPEVEGFRCTILGTFRADEIRAGLSTSWVRVGAAADKVRGRVSLLPLLRKRVEVGAKAGSLHGQLISLGDTDVDVLLRGVRLWARGGRGREGTWVRLESRAASVEELEGGRIRIEAVDRNGDFLLEEALWDLSPGSVRVSGEFSENSYARFSIDVEVEGLDLGRIPLARPSVDGVMSGKAEVRGGVESGWGEASISFIVEDGSIKQGALEGLGELRKLWLVDNGREAEEGVPFEKLAASLAVNAAGVTFRSLELSGENYRVEGTGFASISGKLSMLLGGEFPGAGKGTIWVEGSIYSPEVSWIPIEEGRE